MVIVLRLASTADVPALERLIETSVRALSAGYYSPKQVESALTHLFGVDTQLIADGTYFIAENSEGIVGCGGWSKRQTLFGGDRYKTVADPELDPAVDSARIRAFFVHPDFARQGIGRRLIEACEAAAKTAGFQTFTLVATLPGQPLYAALGYTVTQLLETRLSDGAVLPMARMEKTLLSRPASPQSTPAPVAAGTEPESKSARTGDADGRM